MTQEKSLLSRAAQLPLPRRILPPEGKNNSLFDTSESRYNAEQSLSSFSPVLRSYDTACPDENSPVVSPDQCYSVYRLRNEFQSIGEDDGRDCPDVLSTCKMSTAMPDQSTGDSDTAEVQRLHLLDTDGIENMYAHRCVALRESTSYREETGPIHVGRLCVSDEGASNVSELRISETERLHLQQSY